jgi:hypothetical protein
MEQEQNCAYNQTRECFLGLEIVAGDFSSVSLIDWMPTLTPSSHAGIWMVPFRGISAIDVRVPLDLLYLDESCRVLDTVEFFPTFCVSPSCPPAASVLALPTHSIFSSQTQKGDLLMLCGAKEMEWRLEQLARPGSLARPVPTALKSPGQSVDSKLEEPHRIARPAQAEADGPRGDLTASQSTNTKREAHPTQSADGTIVPTRSWLERWLFPEPQDPRRKSPRKPAPGLTAHFFTGGAPQAHEIRDISAFGLYVVTAERWYPGTLIRMTLSKPDGSGLPNECSITVQARSVRWGNDGVGLELVLESPRKPRPGQPSPLDAVDGNQFDEFLKRLLLPS